VWSAAGFRLEALDTLAGRYVEAHAAMHAFGSAAGGVVRVKPVATLPTFA
jgi:hypothetical protein